MIVDRTEVLETLETLRALADAPETEHRVSELARQRADAIQISQDYLDRRDHSIAFVGQIGIGKSSMIGVLAGLLVGAAPQSIPSMRAPCSVSQAVRLVTVGSSQRPCDRQLMWFAQCISAPQTTSAARPGVALE